MRLAANIEVDGADSRGDGGDSAVDDKHVVPIIAHGDVVDFEVIKYVLLARVEPRDDLNFPTRFG